ncbi:type II secretion system GspH family protein [bacterium]|nr:type II secretion system GspH family protein [bacterium]
MEKNGFTLVELLVVMTIVGILTAVALPEYTAYRARGFDLRALSDLRNVSIAEEAYFLDTEQYLSCEMEECALLPGVSGLSQGVTLDMIASATAFTGKAQHPQGSGRTYHWDSATGGLVMN